MVIQHGGLKAGLQGVNKGLLDVGDLQLADVQTFWWFRALTTSLGLDVKLELGENEAVICLALCTAHGLGDSLPVPLPDDDIVYEMPIDVRSAGASMMSCCR